MIRTLFFMLASASIGYVLYEIFYWRQMHARVNFEDGMLDAPHIMIILGVVGFVLSLM